MSETIQKKHVEMLEAILWRLMSSITSYREGPLKYVSYRLLDGVLGITDILAESDPAYIVLQEQLLAARGLILDDEEEFMKEINRLILDKTRPDQDKAI